MQIKKSRKASLENKKLTYVLVGFVFVLSACFVALEWTEYEVKVWEPTQQAISEDEDIIVNTQQEQTPPPPPPPPAQEVQAFEVVDDKEEVADVDVKDAEDDSEVHIEPPVVDAPPVEDEDEDVIFQVVEKMPEFPGGQQALFKYLSENVKYPVIAQENGIQGRVTCQFTVNKDGSIVDVVVVRSGGDPSLDKEAVRVIKSMPKWNPGQQRNKPVRVKYTVPVNFKLQ